MPTTTMNTPQTLQTSALSSASTVRPRTRKPLATDELSSTALLRSTSSSPYPSRAPSPIPSKHPSRPTPTSTRPSTSSGNVRSSNGASGLLNNSWSAIQGLASTVLGSDTSSDFPKPRARRRKSSLLSHTQISNHPPPLQWGPQAPSTDLLGLGTSNSHASLVRAAKRAELLRSANTNGHDSTGRYKRRHSDDLSGPSTSAPPSGHSDLEQDTTAYIYHVQPSDTLAGILLRFSCSAASFRRANRLWPNDSIQTRRIVILPLSICAVKGRPISDSPNPLPSRPSAVDLLAQTPSSPSLVPQSHTWEHHSWTLLPTLPYPIELARLPAKSLSHFPTRPLLSTPASTPSPSFDLIRPPSTLKPPPAALSGPGGVGTLSRNAIGPAPDSLNRILGPHLPDLGRGEEDGDVGVRLEAVGVAMEGWVRKVARGVGGVLEGKNKNRAFEGDLIELSDGEEVRRGSEGRGRRRVVGGLKNE
ncbi:MAG: hypothetical protein M1814_001453 [Vezdaea aestivalis]|nr:MAG: hypothetical protein M1814_001453 [Vezdaea aestivalis]